MESESGLVKIGCELNARCFLLLISTRFVAPGEINKQTWRHLCGSIIKKNLIPNAVLPLLS